MRHLVAGRIFGFAGLLLAFIALGCNREKASPPAPPPPKVTVAHPVMYPVQSYFEYNGNLRSREAVEVKAQVKGILQQVHFVEGEEVEAGTLLYTIDPREYRAAVSRATADQSKATADIANWKAQIKLAEAELQRLLRSPPAAVTQSEVDKARATVEVNNAQLGVAQATKESAAAALQTANIQLGYTEIKSPIAGRISRTLFTKGNLISTDTLLTTIVSMDPIDVYFDAPERDLGKYQQIQRGKGGPEAVVEIGIGTENGFPHRGKIDFQENRIDVGTGTITLRGQLTNPASGPNGIRLLYPGNYARVRVPVGSPESRPIIPEEAIMTGQEGRFVYVLGPGEVVEKRVVILGTKIWQEPPPGEQTAPGWSLLNPAGGEGKGPLRLSARSVVAIDRGLTSADRIIVNGLQKARPGVPVAPDNWDLQSPTKPEDAKK
jgi:RND family efflux transporter MFP subunit